MALSKTEAAKLTNDMMLRGVIETIVSESAVLMQLPFDDVVGTAVTYNRENAMATVAWRDVGGSWTESTPTFTQVTTPLRILGGDSDVDNFLQQTYRNPNDLKAEVLIAKAKATAYEFSDTFFNGDNGANSLQPDGLVVMCSDESRVLAAGANGADLTLAMMDELIDMVKPGRPDALLMPKVARRQLSALRRSSGNLLETGVDAFGRRAEMYDGIPIMIDDFISEVEEPGSSTEYATSIFAVKWGRHGIGGLENGGIQLVDVGDLETKDASRTRVKWYAALALYSPLGVAQLSSLHTGVTIP